MSVTLEDRDGKTLRVNAWNWGVLHHLVTLGDPPLFADETFVRRLRDGGAQISSEDRDELVAFLEIAVLPLIPPGERMFLNLLTTAESDDGEFDREDLENNYSLQRTVLVAVIEYLKAARPPVSVW